MQQHIHKNSRQRVAYSLSEFADMFGHSRDWAYRLVKDGKVQVIQGYGKMMIPRSEADRLCSLQNKEERS
jgi:predicted site-specific integrase-resolvase